MNKKCPWYKTIRGHRQVCFPDAVLSKLSTYEGQIHSIGFQFSSSQIEKEGERKERVVGRQKGLGL